MATTNVSIGSSWGLAVAAGSDFLLSANDPVEFAVTAGDTTAPTISSGHFLSPGSGVTRDQVGAGSLWVRAVGAPPVKVVVTVLA